MAVVLLLCTTRARAEDTYLLKPEYRKGERFVVSTVLTLDLRGKDTRARGRARTTWLETVLESASGAPRRARRLYTCDTDFVEVRISGRDVVTAKHHPYVGVPILLKAEHGLVTVAGKYPEQETVLKRAWLGTGFDGLLPNGAVKRGETWIPRADPFGPMPAEAGKRGPVTCVFEGMTRWKGKVAAKISVQFHSNRPGQITGFWAWKGSCYFDPEWGKPVWMELKARYHPDHPADDSGHLVYQASVFEPELPASKTGSLDELLKEKKSLEDRERKLLGAGYAPGVARSSTMGRLRGSLERKIDALDDKVDVLLEGG